jgi:hypothetical protein
MRGEYAKTRFAKTKRIALPHDIGASPSVLKIFIKKGIISDEMKPLEITVALRTISLMATDRPQNRRMTTTARPTLIYMQQNCIVVSFCRKPVNFLLL